ncbi:Stealth CR1 domain-containing protein [Alteromonadaceae bacterium BrNp21-10]|nr:Stealth CR1 domain-containing protein [Alteromonadaceae bacterium BrNp21-10]
MLESQGIDVVIFWVDGVDPIHQQKRQQYLPDFQLNNTENTEQSTSLLRFVQHDELKFCLRSIKKFAPWYRKIWLVVDDQTPSFLDCEKMHADRIELVQHQSLFVNCEQYLPTFNSRTLATRLHTLAGLSEFYLLGNDDVMLGNHISPNYFFDQGNPIIYADWSSIAEKHNMTLHQLGIVNGAKMEGYDRDHFLVPSHGFIPFRKSIQQQLACDLSQQFSDNCHFRFRHESQFLPESLYYHHCVNTGQFILKNTEKMVHFSFELCRIGAPEKVKFLFDLILQGERDMFCINEYQSLYPRIPEVFDILLSICGGPLYCEISDCEKGNDIDG